MYKVADHAVDIGNDPGFLKLKKMMSPDSTAMDSDIASSLSDLRILSPEELELLPDNDFALILVDTNGNITRKYPRADVDNAIVSALYLIDSASKLPYKAAAIAASNLLEVIDSKQFKYPAKLKNEIREGLWNLEQLEPSAKSLGNIYRAPKSSLEEDLRKGQGDAIKSEKSARAKLSDSDFVYVFEKNGSKHRMFPVDSVENIIKTASYFKENCTQLPYEHRHKFAKVLRDKVIEKGLKFDTTAISKYASTEWSPVVELSVLNRISLLEKISIDKNEKTAEYEVNFNGGKDKLASIVAYKKLLETAGKCEIDSFSETLHRIDKLAGLTSQYGKNILNPYSSTYAEQRSFYTKEASETISYAGKTISADQIKKFDFSKVAEIIDDFTAKELKSDPINVFNSLPVPYKSVIVDAIHNK